MDFHARMNAVAAALDAAPATTLALAQQLEADLLASDPDPVQFGWARDYHVRALYALERWEDGHRLLATNPPCTFTMTAKNAAWVWSVGGEMAQRAGHPEAILPRMHRALDFRLATGDVDAVMMVIETALALAPDQRDEWLEALQTRIWAGERGAEQPTNLALALARYLNAREAESPLRAAAANGELTDQPLTDLNRRDPCWPGLPTPLIAAAFNGHLAVVDQLLNAGADTTLDNIQGRTALHLAADQDHADIVTRLVAAGADPNAKDFQQCTPLHVCGWQGYVDCVQALIDGGADLEARNINGATPLAISASEPVPEVVQALLAAGADAKTVDYYGRTPLDRAKESGGDAVVALLTP